METGIGWRSFAPAMLAGLIARAPYGYADWLGVLAWAVLGNAVGGIGLVTVLRLVQAGGQGDVELEGAE